MDAAECLAQMEAASFFCGFFPQKKIERTAGISS